jgi:IS30 family transposase
MTMERLNNRPRKRLGYQASGQVFFKSDVALDI